MEEMTLDQANKIYNDYNKADEAFRLAKKRGNHRTASEHKAKRDSLATLLQQAIKVRKANS